jgi:hypothetical protein
LPIEINFTHFASDIYFFLDFLKLVLNKHVKASNVFRFGGV